MATRTNQMSAIMKKYMTAKTSAAIAVVSLWLMAALYAVPALAATLLPPGEITFVDANGAPLTGGTVQFYIPNTTTPKDTWQDASQSTLNTNPVVLNSAGRAIIYGSGCYRQVVKDSLSNLIWDQSTCDTAPATGTAWGGTSGGTPNVQTVVAPDFSGGNGQILEFLAGSTNTGSLTLNPNGSGPINVYKQSPSGPVAMTGGEVVAGNLIMLSYDGVQFQLISGAGSGGGAAAGPFTSLASATTTSLCSIPSHNVTITGTTTIASFGSTGCDTDYPIYNIVFAGSLTVTYNGTSMIVPGATDLATTANTSAVAIYNGGSNWTIIDYTPASGIPLRLTSGTPAQGDVLYYGSTSQTPTRLAAGTSGMFLKTLGAGANPLWAVPATSNYQTFTTTGTWTKPSVSANSETYIACWGAGGGGNSSSSAGGGGGASYAYRWIPTSSLGSTETVTIPAGGAIATGGGNATFGSWLTAFGGGASTAGNTGGGGGGGALAAGANSASANGGAGGGPAGGTGAASAGAGSTDSTAGGGGGGAQSSTGGASSYYGGGGGGGNTTNGGKSVWGGGGGGGASGSGGTSTAGGAGGDSGVAGTAPGGGGGRNAAGARGECDVWTSG